MKTSPFKLVAQILCVASAYLAAPSPAHASSDGINRLVNVASLKADLANDEALTAADKQRDLVRQQVKVRAAQKAMESFEAPAPPQENPSPATQAELIVQDITVLADFESKASADGIDDAEKQSLADLVGVALARVDGASAEASAEIASAKQLLKQTSSTDEKAALKLRVKSLRATAKAHKQTAAALRALAKKLAE